MNESDSSGETKRKLNAFVNLKKEHELDFLVPLINAVSNDVHCKRVSDSFIYLFTYYISTSFGKLLIVAKIFMQKLTFFKVCMTCLKVQDLDDAMMVIHFMFSKISASLAKIE